MKKYVLKIEGMSCNGCKNRLENYLNSQKKIKKAKVSLEKKQAIIECDEDLELEDIKKFVNEVGFECK